VVRTDDKRRGRLNLITHLLGQVPYEPLPPRTVRLPERSTAPVDGARGLGGQAVPTPF
jgi:hypothetical protein